MIIKNGDHSVILRLAYWVKNVYGLFDAEFAINRAAYAHGQQQDVTLNTPLTHKVISE
ncbi:MAG: hypothetical protein COA63_006890 [Methylophaga sp.]|nr:hypothetical protein [Methylophaga sp.]